MNKFKNVLCKVRSGRKAEIPSALPEHIGIIMDGNGRWAKKRGLPRSAGHRAGSETFRRIATYCSQIGIKYLTVYAFSTENWSRPKEEVDAIMALLKEYLLESCEKIVKENIALKVLGERSMLSSELQELIARAEKLSEGTTGLKVQVCINYGGRDEITKAARFLADKAAKGMISPDEINEQVFSDVLYTAEIPDPDLIIRPSGELRLSNFLLWQSAYTELYFTDTLWPDFDENELNRALSAYSGRSRRFGGI